MSFGSSAQALDWTHSHEEIRKLSALLGASQALLGASDFKHGLQSVLETLSVSFGALASRVVLLNQETGEIDVEASSGRRLERAGPVRHGFRDRVVGDTVLNGKPIVVPVARPELRVPAQLSTRSSGQKVTYIAVPIPYEGQTIGQLEVELEFTPNHDYERTVTFLSVVGAMIAQAMKVHRLIEADRQRLVEENAHLRLELHERYGFANIVGASRQMQDVYAQVAQVAKTNTTVLLRGESGTGKELIAHAIHHNSARAKKPFIKVSCAALPNDLIESELFGYEKGAFTGAHAPKKGRFELAEGGTLFLDEIGELNLATQVKLLRVLQAREFERLGGTQTIQTDIRLIAATNKDLEAAILGKGFREDLFYRLNVFAIFIPPLRDRKTDVLQLANYFLEKFATQHAKNVKRIATPAIDMLMAYHWPGNVRELENAIERAVVVCNEQVLHAHHLPPTLQTAEETGTVIEQSLEQATEAFEKDILQDALKSARGNRAKAARLLRTTGRVFNYKVRKYGIDWKRFKR
jgi:Nif-specific regulatory protein